jgi:hypothetical protein
MDGVPDTNAFAKGNRCKLNPITSNCCNLRKWRYFVIALNCTMVMLISSHLNNLWVQCKQTVSLNFRNNYKPPHQKPPHQNFRNNFKPPHQKPATMRYRVIFYWNSQLLCNIPDLLTSLRTNLCCLIHPTSNPDQSVTKKLSIPIIIGPRFAHVTYLIQSCMAFKCTCVQSLQSSQPYSKQIGHSSTAKHINARVRTSESE